MRCIETGGGGMRQPREVGEWRSPAAKVMSSPPSPPTSEDSGPTHSNQRLYVGNCVGPVPCEESIFSPLRRIRGPDVGRKARGTVDRRHPTEDAGATMHGHLHGADDAVHRPRAVSARPDDHRLLVLQRTAGNRAVAAWVQGDAPVVQRCGGETHAGCPCAEQSTAGRM